MKGWKKTSSSNIIWSTNYIDLCEAARLWLLFRGENKVQSFFVAQLESFYGIHGFQEMGLTIFVTEESEDTIGSMTSQNGLLPPPVRGAPSITPKLVFWKGEYISIEQMYQVRCETRPRNQKARRQLLTTIIVKESALIKASLGIY